MKSNFVAIFIVSTCFAQVADGKIASLLKYSLDSEVFMAVAEPRANALANMKVGDDVVLSVSSGEVVVCVDKKAYAEFLKLSVAKDYLGMAQMERQGKLFTVTGGTKAKIIGAGFEIKNVRIMNGLQIGRSGWVTASLVSL